MMRKIAIIGAFLAGLLGLFMSLCGGGFFIMLASNSAGDSAFLLVPATFALLGVALSWASFKFIRRRNSQGQLKNGER